MIVGTKSARLRRLRRGASFGCGEERSALNRFNTQEGSFAFILRRHGE
jgi:hypothetical protein